jgi:hypothetical protein
VAGTSFTPSQSVTLFAGWTNGTTSYTYNTTVPTASSVTKPSTVVGTYTISYSANGGNSTPVSQTSNSIKTYTWDNKWYTAANGGN